MVISQTVLTIGATGLFPVGIPFSQPSGRRVDRLLLEREARFQVAPLAPYFGATLAQYFRALRMGDLQEMREAKRALRRQRKQTAPEVQRAIQEQIKEIKKWRSSWDVRSPLQIPASSPIYYALVERPRGELVLRCESSGSASLICNNEIPIAMGRILREEGRVPPVPTYDCHVLESGVVLVDRGFDYKVGWLHYTVDKNLFGTELEFDAAREAMEVSFPTARKGDGGFLNYQFLLHPKKNFEQKTDARKTNPPWWLDLRFWRWPHRFQQAREKWQKNVEEAYQAENSLKSMEVFLKEIVVDPVQIPPDPRDPLFFFLLRLANGAITLRRFNPHYPNFPIHPSDTFLEGGRIFRLGTNIAGQTEINPSTLLFELDKRSRVGQHILYEPDWERTEEDGVNTALLFKQLGFTAVPIRETIRDLFQRQDA